jgi:hypothetical protein
VATILVRLNEAASMIRHSFIHNETSGWAHRTRGNFQFSIDALGSASKL